MDDVYSRYRDASAAVASARAAMTAAQQTDTNRPTGRAAMGLGESATSIARRGLARAEAQFSDADAQRKLMESRLAGTNAQLTATANSTNQRAAIQEQAAPAEAVDGAAELLVPGDGDTETPGGASGRRRRKTEAVGSIRI